LENKETKPYITTAMCQLYFRTGQADAGAAFLNSAVAGFRREVFLIPPFVRFVPYVSDIFLR